MSVNLYDEALVRKVRNWVKDKNVTILSPDDSSRLFNFEAMVSEKDKLQLPLISITRDRQIDVRLTGKRPDTSYGRVFNSENGRTDHLNSVPITLTYQIDIYTKYEAECLEYVRNFVFNIINYPKLVIDIPYNDSQLKQASYMSLQPAILNNSDIPERVVAGQFYRYAIGFKLKDAYLYSYNVKDIPQVEAGVDIASEYIEVIKEESN